MFTKHAEELFEKEAKVTPSVAFQKLKEVLTGKQFLQGMQKFDTRKSMFRKAEDVVNKRKFPTEAARKNAENTAWNFTNKQYPLSDSAKDIFGGAAKTTAAYALPVVGAHKYLKSKDVDPFDPKNYQHLE